MAIVILILLFLFLLVIEVPVAFAMVLSSFLYLALEQTIPMSIVPQRMASGLDSFPLLAVPLFILAGNLMNHSGIAVRIFDFAQVLVGHIRGGLGHVNIMASIIFSGMSGVASADAAGLGTVEIKAMREAGYDPAFSAAVTAASSTIGPIIPPSVIMIIYAMLMQVSTGDMFLAGIIPGLIMGGMMMALIYYMAVTGKVRAPVHPVATLLQIGRAFIRAFPALLAPVFLVGGIVLGVATPTELGALTVIYAIVLGFAYGDLKWCDLVKSLTDTLVISGVLIFIVSAAIPFGWLVAITGIPSKLVDAVLALTQNKIIILAFINVFLLVVGCFLEAAAILLVATPALWPLADALGLDPVHFGIIMVVNLLVGMLTPPFGMLIFIVKHIAEISYGQMLRAVVPFYIPLFLVLLLVKYVLDVVLWVPRLVSGP